LEQAIALHGEPHKITIDQSGANTAAIENYNADHHTDIELRQCKYLNNIVGAPGKVWRFQRVKIPHRQGASHPTGNRALGLWR
jgi:transposase-like protein